MALVSQVRRTNETQIDSVTAQSARTVPGRSQSVSAASVPNMKDAEIYVALIGYGLGGRSFHAPVIAVTPGMRLAAIVTGNAERQQLARTEHPGARIVDTPEELFRDP